MWFSALSCWLFTAYSICVTIRCPKVIITILMILSVMFSLSFLIVFVYRLAKSKNRRKFFFDLFDF